MWHLRAQARRTALLARGTSCLSLDLGGEMSASSRASWVEWRNGPRAATRAAVSYPDAPVFNVASTEVQVRYLGEALTRSAALRQLVNHLPGSSVADLGPAQVDALTIQGKHGVLRARLQE